MSEAREVIARVLHAKYSALLHNWTVDADAILAALDEAGFDVGTADDRAALPRVGGEPMSDLRMSDKRVCPDGGTCHHDCADDAVCFRVQACEPLSGTRYANEWRRHD